MVQDVAQDVAQTPGGATLLEWFVGLPLGIAALLLVIWMLIKAKKSEPAAKEENEAECRVDTAFKAKMYDTARTVDAMAEIVTAKDENQAPKLLKSTEYMAKIEEHMAGQTRHSQLQTEHMAKQTEYMGILSRNLGLREADGGNHGT